VPDPRLTAARGLGWGLRNRRVVAALTIAYLLIGAYFIATDYSLNDEGLQTFTVAELLRHEPLAVFFVQKVKPVLAVLYAPVVGFGLLPFLVMHLVLAAVSVPLISSVARALGFALPNVPAAVMAFSPVFLMVGPAGISNADGVTGLTLMLYLLLVRGSGVAAGLVLGMLPWVRHELALFVVFFVVRAVFFTREWRFAAATAVFPLVYALSGAVYHWDLLWLIHYPPQTWAPAPNSPGWFDVSWAWLLRHVVLGLIGLTPISVFAFAVPVGGLQPVERWLLWSAAAWFGLSTALSPWRVANFAIIPRHLLVVLPQVALLAGRAAEIVWNGEMHRVRLIAASAALCTVWAFSDLVGIPAVTAIMAGLLAAVILTVGRRRVAAVCVLIGLIACGPIAGVPTELSLPETAPYLPGLSNWLRANAGRVPVFTNVPLLAAYVDRPGRLPGLDVRYLFGPDKLWDIAHMTSEASQQRANLPGLLRHARFNYAVNVLPTDLVPDRIPEGSLFVMRVRDNRSAMLLPPDVWRSHLEPLQRTSYIEISRFVGDRRSQAGPQRRSANTETAPRWP
jgi:hypothetical protein